jgi:ER lumen protein retaining receptor
MRSFSLILESVCVLPQLILLRETSVPTVIDSFYLLTLGAYRALYIGNWIERGITEPGQPETISVVFGVIQTLLYADFAWVYWTRQRVKLRNGAVVDTDDLSRGFLVSKVLGRVEPSFDEEGSTDQDRRDWGARGISVSADEDSAASRPIPPAKDHVSSAGIDARPEESRRMLNPEVFEDDDSDVDATLPQSRPTKASSTTE